MASDDTTSNKTLWSQTILEVLYAALLKKRSDARIVEILHVIQNKGFQRTHIIRKVEAKVDKEAARRIKRLFDGKPSTLSSA